MKRLLVALTVFGSGCMAADLRRAETRYAACLRDPSVNAGDPFREGCNFERSRVIQIREQKDFWAAYAREYGRPLAADEPESIRQLRQAHPRVEPHFASQ
jgi:hypothetical protein